LRVAGCSLRVARCGLRVALCGLLVAGCSLLVAVDYRLPITDNRSPTTDHPSPRLLNCLVLLLPLRLSATVASAKVALRLYAFAPFFLPRSNTDYRLLITDHRSLLISHFSTLQPTPLTPKPSLPPSVTATQVEESYGLQSKGAHPQVVFNSGIRFLITDHRSPITDYRSPTTDYRLPLTDHHSPPLPISSSPRLPLSQSPPLLTQLPAPSTAS